MWNGCGDLIFNTCIQHNYGWEGIRRCPEHDFFWFFKVFFDVWRMRVKIKQSGNVSTIWFPGLNSLLKKEKEGKHWLHLSSTLIIDDLSQLLCLAIWWLMDTLWLLCSCILSKLRMLWIMWLDGREDYHSKNLLYSFFK